jgi:hypothetical protein
VSFDTTLLEELVDEIKEFSKRIPLRVVLLLLHNIVSKLECLTNHYTGGSGGDNDVHGASASAAKALIKASHDEFSDVVLVFEELIENLGSFGLNTHISAYQLARKNHANPKEALAVLVDGSDRNGVVKADRRGADGGDFVEGAEKVAEEILTIGLDSIAENALLDLEHAIVALFDGVRKLPRPPGTPGVIMVDGAAAAKAMAGVDTNIRQKCVAFSTSFPVPLAAFPRIVPSQFCPFNLRQIPSSSRAAIAAGAVLRPTTGFSTPCRTPGTASRRPSPTCACWPTRPPVASVPRYVSIHHPPAPYLGTYLGPYLGP